MDYRIAGSREVQAVRPSLYQVKIEDLGKKVQFLIDLLAMYLWTDWELCALENELTAVLKLEAKHVGYLPDGMR